MNLEIRTLTPDDIPAAWSVLGHAFGGPDDPSDQEVEFPLVDPERFYGTYDGDIPVATGGSFALRMTVPGAQLPVAGVTWIGVLPTHRRRGLLTALKRRMLDDLHAAGEPVAALWASQGAIYQRFGYGAAAWDLALTVPRGAAFNRPVSATGVRIVPVDASVLTGVYQQVAGRTPGWPARDEKWWRYRLHDPESHRSGASPLRLVVADGADGVAGYALYATRQDWGKGLSSSTIHVREVVGVDADAKARLWRYLLDLDLMVSLKTHNTAIDEPLLHLLAEPRAAIPRLKDNLYVRLVDVAAALPLRSFATEVDVVLDVADDFCPWNAGRYRLRGGPSGATCTPTTDAPDLSLDARDLGAAYLGGTTLVARAAAGDVVEHRAGALTAASLAFGWAGPAPYCPMVF